MKRHVSNQPQRNAVQQALEQLRSPDPEGAVAALSQLCALAKTKEANALIQAGLADRAEVYGALNSPLPKARKNAARLLGALADERDEQALIDALAREETLFVRPSLILALGAAGGEAARAYLETLPVPAGEDKHAREEALALQTAVARLTPAAKHTFTGLQAPREARLTAPAGFGPVLEKELGALGIKAQKTCPDSVTIQAREMKQVFRARCFTELLFPLAEFTLLSQPGGGLDARAAGKAAAEAVKAPMLELLHNTHREDAPFPYRIECRLETDRKAFAQAFINAMQDAPVYNAPSAYEAEVRITPGERGRARAELKLFTYPDQRFAYRKNAISASIHPAAAAALCRYSLEFTPKDKELRVLDPCCGSGTLLIERGKLSPCMSLTGVELVGATVEKARENCALAHSNAKIIHKDCLIFDAREPYDLVISNLPFGTRVGTHEDNERLYTALIKKLPQWLALDGIAILYTMEYSLLQRCIHGQKAMVPVAETRTAAGGLLPWAIVLRRVQ